MFMSRRLLNNILLIVLLVISFPHIILLVVCQDAEVFRNRNLQFFQMTPQTHPAGSALISRVYNLQFFEMTPEKHPPGDALVRRMRNLQFFQLEPLDYQYQIWILNLRTTDENGNSKTDYQPSEIVYINFTIINIDAQGNMHLYNGIVSILIKDPNQNIVLFTYEHITLLRGESRNYIFAYKIPYEAQTGTYTIKITVYTALPSQGGYGLATNQTTFNITT